MSTFAKVIIEHQGVYFFETVYFALGQSQDSLLVSFSWSWLI